jgi:hypothetical protein
VKVRRLLPVLAASFSAVACSLLVGTSDLATTDGPGDLEGGVDSGSPDAGADGADPRPDASGGDAACLPAVRVDETFTTSLGGWTKHSYAKSGVIDYPALEAYDGVVSTVLLPMRDLYFSRSGLWYPAAVPLVALDVSADVDVRCSPTSCADGLLMVWLDTRDHAVLDDEAIGGRPLPGVVAGAGIALDTYQDPANNEPPAPSLQVIAPGRPGAPELDSWKVESVATPFVGGPHRLAIRLRGDKVSVSYDGALRLSGIVPVFTSGLFGFVASTGGQTNAAAIRNVTASFYACTPP